jgi:hypothetical protein
MSAPNSPGGLMSVSASRSVATVTIAPCGVGFFRERLEVVDRAERIGILHQRAEDLESVNSKVS